MKKKIAILGGGCGSMTAAYYLSNTPELRERFEVTVYQMGWRLGGKGASGRNQAIHDRIEEHGLHVWGGFYYNSFRMMRECYGALGANVWEMFVPHDHVGWGEYVDGRWLTWPLSVPSTPGELPGLGPAAPSLGAQLARIIGWIREAIQDWPHGQTNAGARRPGCLGRIAAAAEMSLAAVVDAAYEKICRLAEQPSGGDWDPLRTLIEDLARRLRYEVGEVIESHNDLRRIFVMMDLALALVRGILADHLHRDGLMKVDEVDLAEWLRMHGASELSLASAPLQGYYDYFLAYENGDSSRPRMSAGMGIAHLLRLVGDYRGAMFWKMQSGMGDAVFAPLYQLCVQNGVRFRFFHRVVDVVPAVDGQSIAAIHLNRQVTLKDGTYDPLIRAKIASWPSEPRWELIADNEAREMQQLGVNLEDPWNAWPGTPVTLHAGTDYDAVILGLSIGAFGQVCSRIIASRPDWAAMAARLQTIQTVAMQFWWNKTVSDLGWGFENTTGTSYASPFQSWSDMSGALPMETWPPGPEAPQALVYFCGPMLNPPSMPNGMDPEFGREQTRKAWEQAFRWAQQNLGMFFPRLDWSDFVDDGNGVGEARFAAQYARANYAPTERYVLDLPGTNRYRLEADTSGYANLVLAGDWLFTGLGGAVESAVITGMQAARTLAGSISDPIVGEVQSPWRRPVSVRPL